MIILILLIYSYKILGFIPVLIEGTCYQNPVDICMSVCKIGVIANSSNIHILIDELRRKNIENAYVYGWENHRNIMVLFKNGALAPYIPDRVFSKYAFCLGKCPCKPRVVNGDACGTLGQDTCCNTVNVSNTCHAPDNVCHVPDNTCNAPDNVCHAPENTCYQNYEECYDRNELIISDPSTPTSKCHLRPKHHKSTKRHHQQPKYRSCNSKTFEYDCTKRNEIELKIKEEQISTIINPVNSTELQVRNLPEVLKYPTLLLKIRNKLQKKYYCEVCLYVTDDNKLYADIKSELYYLNCIRYLKKRKQYVLVRINYKKKEELIRKGLHLIIFNYELVNN